MGVTANGGIFQTVTQSQTTSQTVHPSLLIYPMHTLTLQPLQSWGTHPTLKAEMLWSAVIMQFKHKDIIVMWILEK